MKPGCPTCQTGQCRVHKYSPYSRFMRKYGPRRWYWEVVALWHLGFKNKGSRK